MRSDGSSKEYVTRALDSVFKQTHQDFKIYLIGDHYEDNDEFNEIVSKYGISNQLYAENRPFALERYLYKSGKNLWCSGGVDASNYAIDLVLNDGLTHVCRLDHDDFWSENHLSLINNAMEKKGYDFVCTMGYGHNGAILPNLSKSKLIPKSSNVLHSSTCINFSRIKLRYRDLFAEVGIAYPADADMWDRINKLSNIRTALIPEITCYHDRER